MSEKKKVFISGPMSGIKDFNKPAFDKAEQWLTEAGYSVFNPARMHFDDSWTHEEIMRIDLAALSQCDYILMLPKWYYSKGAIQEYHYANAIGVKLLSESDILKSTKTRIQIESFGDISGRTLDFLLWFEKRFNEILANGGDINELSIDWEPKDAPKKSCNTCKYVKYMMLEEPCKSCTAPFTVGNHTKWEPKEE